MFPVKSATGERRKKLHLPETKKRMKTKKLKVVGHCAYAKKIKMIEKVISVCTRTFPRLLFSRLKSCKLFKKKCLQKGSHYSSQSPILFWYVDKKRLEG
jgi:hypothetical protein